jgi:hypothetical protein
VAGKADATATFAINLEDGTSGAAQSATKALEQLRSTIDSDTKALAAMQKSMKGLQSGTSVNIAQFRELKAKIDAKKQSISAAEASYLSLGGTYGATGRSSARLASFMDKLTASTNAVGGPVQGLTSRVGGLGSVLKAGGAVLGLVALAAAMVAVTVAAVAGAGALAKYGIAQADARRNEQLHLEGLTKLRNWYGLAAGNADEMQSSIDRVSGATSLGRAELGKYTDQLYKMGLRGANLDQALEGVALKAQVQGEAAANAFAGWAAGAAMAGGSVKRLTDDVKARLGGIAAKQMLSLGVQSKKLGESFDALFSGLKIEGLLRGLSSVTSMFSQANASGQALKSMITVMFGPLINGAESAGLVVKRFFQGMVIGALTIGIALLKVRNWFKATFGSPEILKGFDLQKAAVYAGVIAVGALAAELTIAGAAMAALAGYLAVVLLPIYKFGKAAYDVYNVFASIDWSELGTNLVQGIVRGVKGGARWVIDAVRGLGESAMAAFKSKLGIASPSKMFAKLGVTLPQGVQAGIERGKPGLDRDVAELVDVPELAAPGAKQGPAAPAAPGAKQGPAATGPIAFHFGEFHFHGTGQTREWAQEFRQRLAEELETVVVQLGGRLPGTV